MTMLESVRLAQEAEIAQELRVPAVNVCLVGSTLIVGAGNDRDFLVLLEHTNFLPKLGFEPDLTEGAYPSGFESWRRGDVNLVATTDRGFFLSEVAIAEAARTLYLHDRERDKTLFDMTTREGRVLFHSSVRMCVEIRLMATPLFEGPLQ